MSAQIKTDMLTVAVDEKLKKRIQHLAALDASVVVAKDAQYGSSWKRRGGVGAFMMLARKWDRIENFVRAHGYDIFATVEAEPSIVEDMMDLGCYMWLVRSEGLLVEEVEVTAPDQFCATTPDGDCVSEDPRCMHQPVDLQNPYAFVPDEKLAEEYKDDGLSQKTREFFSVGDTELRRLYGLSEKDWFSVPAKDRVELIVELRAHYALLRMDRNSPRDLRTIANEYGVTLTGPIGGTVYHPEDKS